MNTPTMTREQRATLRASLLLRALNALMYATSSHDSAGVVGRLMDDEDPGALFGDAGLEELRTVAAAADALPSPFRLDHPLRSCGHPLTAEVAVDHDQWLRRMAFHLELALRHLQDDPELATPMHRSVAREMVTACLDDYGTLREQQDVAQRIAAGPCRPCDLQTRGVA
jgi:hypothetical protein